MKKRTMIRISVILLFFIISCQAQTEQSRTELSDDFDSSFPFSYRMPSQLSSSDTSRGWFLEDEPILLTGIVYESDGVTPASNVILYYYQTNAEGVYEHKEEEEISMPPNRLGQTHGYIRGWVKTDSNGRYAIYTSLPGSYPSRNEAAHIHLSVKEVGKDVYYIDNFVFDDDRLLTSEKRQSMENRGGSGVIRFVEKDGLRVGERPIYLGLNVPANQRAKDNEELASGRSIGEEVVSFTPYHAWGPDKGTRTCPICKYGWYNGVLYFASNRSDWNEIKTWLQFLEKESINREDYLKVYFIYGSGSNASFAEGKTKLEQLGQKLGLKKVALTVVSSFQDRASDVYLNEINPEVENTFLIYRRVKIIDKFINLTPTKEHFVLISNGLDRYKNEYFDLPRAR